MEAKAVIVRTAVFGVGYLKRLFGDAGAVDGVSSSPPTGEYFDESTMVDSEDDGDEVGEYEGEEGEDEEEGEEKWED